MNIPPYTPPWGSEEFTMMWSEMVSYGPARLQAACGFAFDLGRENEQLADYARTLGAENVRLNTRYDEQAARWNREAERRRAIRCDIGDIKWKIDQIFKELGE